jgi:hypothetical protein
MVSIGRFEWIDRANYESRSSAQYNSAGHGTESGVGQRQQHTPFLRLIEA